MSDHITVIVCEPGKKAVVKGKGHTVQYDPT